MKRLVPIIVLLSSLLCGCYNNYGESSQKEFAERATHNISHLRALCGEVPYNISDEIVCIGRVTSSDTEGNFYRTVVIEDESGAVEVKLGIYNLARQYPIGLMVALRLEGTAIMLNNGVVEVGLPPSSHDSSPREMESQEIIDRHIVRSYSVAPIQPLHTDIPSLDKTQCGRFLRIEHLRYSPLDNEITDTGKEYYRLTDQNDNILYLQISPYAKFADIEIFDSEIDVQGILYHGSVDTEELDSKQFIIKPRYGDDISRNSSTL